MDLDLVIILDTYIARMNAAIDTYVSRMSRMSTICS